MADQPVERVGRRRAGVALDARDGVVVQHGFSASAAAAPAVVSSGVSSGMWTIDLQLALVVERQHLDGHDAERHQRRCGDQAEPRPAPRNAKRVDGGAMSGRMTRR